MSDSDATSNPVGNASVQWVTDPLTHALVRAGTENVLQPDGSYRDGNGVTTDPAGTAHTYYFDQGNGNPGAPPPETLHRPGVSAPEVSLPETPAVHIVETPPLVEKPAVTIEHAHISAFQVLLDDVESIPAHIREFWDAHFGRHVA